MTLKRQNIYSKTKWVWQYKLRIHVYVVREFH